MARKYIKALVFIWLALSWASLSFAGPTTTSGITAGDILTRARYTINEATADFWSDTILLSYINEAVWEIYNRTQPLESGASNISVYENTRSYPIPDTISGVSFGGVAKVEYDQGLSGDTTYFTQIYDLTRVPFANLQYNKDKEIGNPKAYSVWANALFIWPIPGSNQSGNTLYLYNLVAPSGVTDTTSSIETPAYFDAALLDYITYRALFRDHQEERGDFYRKIFYEKIEYYRQNIMKRDVGNDQ